MTSGCPSAMEASAAIAAGRLTSQRLVATCLERIEARDSEVGAWAFVDPQQALAAARAADHGDRKGPLHGLPVGIKDIIATGDMPTACGSPIYDGFRPATDAACVALLRQAGAVVLGKTETTEFAFSAPARTRNPLDLDRTPGGSSSGSAAAVADHMVPLALGTQTGGSVIRPASFCGVFAMKPSFHLVPREGVKPLAPSFDTVGWFGRCIADLALLAEAFGLLRAPRGAPSRPLRIGVCRTANWQRAEDASREAIEVAAANLRRSGAEVVDFDLPASFAALDEAYATIMAVDAARALRVEASSHPNLLSPGLAALLEGGRDITMEQEHAARLRFAEARSLAADVLVGTDALLTPAAVGEAPQGLASTGDPMFNKTWTALHLPCITLPTARGPGGMPVGIQLVGAWGRDALLLDVAAEVEARLLAVGQFTSPSAI